MGVSHEAIRRQCSGYHINLAVKRREEQDGKLLREEALSSGPATSSQSSGTRVSWVSVCMTANSRNTPSRPLVVTPTTSNSKRREALAKRHQYQQAYKRQLPAHARGARGHRIIGRTPCRDHLIIDDGTTQHRGIPAPGSRKLLRYKIVGELIQGPPSSLAAEPG